VRHGARVDAVQFLYSDPSGKTRMSDRFGGDGGEKTEIRFRANERLIHIHGKITGDRIGQIWFETNQRTLGRDLPLGRSGDRYFKCGEGGEIVRIRIRSGEELDAVGASSHR